MLARLSSAVAVSLALAGFIAAGGACSSDSDATTSSSSGNGSSGNASSGGSTTTLTSSECTSRCSTKLKSCPDLASQAGPGCTQVCGGSVTEGQASCLEAKSCDELLQSFGEGQDLDAVCPKSSGGSSSGSSGSTSGQSSSGSSSGGSNDTPTNLTITATIPSDGAVIHTSSSGKVASLFNVAPKPSFDPNVQINASHLPLLDKAASVTLDSPDRPTGACGTSKFTFVLNSTQIGVQIAGSDTLPATDCAAFTDELAKGATFTLTGVPWNNSSVKSTVKIVLK